MGETILMLLSDILAVNVLILIQFTPLFIRRITTILIAFPERNVRELQPKQSFNSSLLRVCAFYCNEMVPL